MKKGFTLIELLAVIVILVVIALISTPIIVGLIDDAKKESFKSSGYGIVKAGEILYSKDMMNGTIEEVTFTYTNGIETSTEEKKLDYNGSKPNSGEVKINENGELALAIHNGKYCARKAYYESEVIISDKSEEECKIFICGEDVLYDSRDRQKYKTVQIGDQCWMAENLKYTSNGCLEKNWTSGENNACMEHQAGQGGYQGEYNNWTDPQVLYQWAAAMSLNEGDSQDAEELDGAQGICPSGWHVPKNTEWETLISSVSGDANRIKAELPAWDGSNSSKFNALPTGARYEDNSLYDVGNGSYFWTSFLEDSIWPWYRDIYSGVSTIYGCSNPQNYGFSVRCLLE